jgi:hypothetical protein
MRGLLVVTTVVAALIVGTLAARPVHADGPDITDRQALAELVFAAPPLAALDIMVAGAARADLRQKRRRGPMGRQEWRRIVSWALRNLDDRIALAESPLGQLRGVTALAEAQFGERCWPEGLAVRELLDRAVETVDDRLRGDAEAADLRAVLRSVVGGETVAQLARRMGLRRETVHRRLWAPVCDLVLNEFQRLDRETAACAMAIQERASLHRVDVPRASPAAETRSGQLLATAVPSGGEPQAGNRAAVHR